MDKEFLNQLHEANPIEQVVSDYVHTKRAGKNYVCSCPFHSDKSPSCTIFVDTQSFYCFGCGTGGDVITFVKKIENLSFGEAVEKLASRCGMKVPTDEKTKRLSYLKERILDINRETANFYYKMLLKGKDKSGLIYFSKRNIKPSTIKKYGLGFAPDSFDVLYKHLHHLGYTDDELIEAQVCRRGKHGMYDLFRNRVMFPIINIKGSVIAFGGRVLDDSKPKYLNTPQTKVFDKGRNCFSFNFAKNSSSKTIILAEGYMDVISMNQAGFENVIATLGTAVTEEQARLISQYAERVAISYDSDEAGQRATRRAINILSDAGLKTSVLKIEGAKDPDEFIRLYGTERFKRIVNDAGDAIDFQIEQCSVGLDLENESDKGKFIKKSSEIIADVSSDIMQEIYISNFCKKYDFNKEIMRSHIKNIIEKNRKEKENEIWRQASGKSYKNKNTFLSESKREKAEKFILTMLLTESAFYEKIYNNIESENFSNDLVKKIIEIIKSKSPHDISFALLSEYLDDDEMGKVSGILISNKDLRPDPEDIEIYLDIVKQPLKDVTESITDQDILDIVNAKKL